MTEQLRNIKRTRIGYIEMRMMFPDMQPATLSSIVQHYRSFEPIRRKHTKHQQDDDPAHRMMTQISVMLGVPLPSLHEVLSSSAELQRRGYQEHHAKTIKKEQMLEALVQQQVPSPLRACECIQTPIPNLS